MNKREENIKAGLYRLWSDIPSVPPKADTSISQKLFKARESFMEGYRRTLTIKATGSFEIFRDFEGDHLGFALEGAGLAATLFDEMARPKENFLPKLSAGLSDIETSFIAIGIGWASAKLGRPIDWRPPGIWAEILHCDGYGFYHGFFGRSGQLLRDHKNLKEDQWIAIRRGIGRSLWFTYWGNEKLISRHINGMPEGSKDQLWYGVGVASGFTNTSGTLNKVTEEAGIFADHLLQGHAQGQALTKSLSTSNRSLKETHHTTLSIQSNGKTRFYQK